MIVTNRDKLEVVRDFIRGVKVVDDDTLTFHRIAMTQHDKLQRKWNLEISKT